MSQAKVLKGVFREDPLIASVVQEGSSARIMLKGIEPDDAAFLETLKRVTAACDPHLQGFSSREFCLVALERPETGEHLQMPADANLTSLSVLDGNCGIAVQRLDTEPPPTPLAYMSLRAGGPMAEQPGRALIPPELPRLGYKSLTDPQKKVFEAAAQVAGGGLIRLVCVEDEGPKLVVTVRDLPPARARSLFVPLDAYANDLAGGTPLDEIGRRLQPLRAV